jgi:predicted nuclease of restriction endonuclease-like (RecB) superfamily
MSKLVPTPADNLQGALHAELRALIASSRQRLAGAVNAELTRLYWSVGQRLHTEVLGDARASYGAKLLDQLGQKLAHEFGRGFESRNLRRMVKFAEAFPHAAIVSTLSTKLSWSHMVAIVAIKNPQAHLFYAQQAAQDGWSVRELHHQIERKAFERTLLAATQGDASPPLAPTSVRAEPVEASPALVFKDPYFLDFLGLRQGHDEADLESAILRQLEAFILELGRGFAFVERQKRMVIDGDDFYLDLLFYHRRLRRLVAIELKLGRFKAAHKGQMELYLKWLDKHERQAGEEAPIGLILCAESSREQVELLQMHKDGITVAEYWTELPPKAELEQHLHKALLEARERLARRGVLLSESDDE